MGSIDSPSERLEVQSVTLHCRVAHQQPTQSPTKILHLDVRARLRRLSLLVFSVQVSVLWFRPVDRSEH